MKNLKFLLNKIVGSLSTNQTLETLELIKSYSKNSNLIKLADEIQNELESRTYNKSKLEKTTFTMFFRKDHHENPDVDKEPEWFKSFRVENDERFESIENFIQEQQKFNKQMLKFKDDQLKFNQQQLEFNRYVLEVFKCNNLK